MKDKHCILYKQSILGLIIKAYVSFINKIISKSLLHHTLLVLTLSFEQENKLLRYRFVSINFISRG